MKKIKASMIFLAFFLTVLSSQSQSITYRFNNYMVIPGFVHDTLIFDIEAKSNVGTTYTACFSVFVNFSEAAFGPNAVPVSVQRLNLTLPAGYNWNTPASNAGSNRFASSFQAFIILPPFMFSYQTAYLSNLTTAFQAVARYKMVITGTGPLGIGFDTPGMTGQSLYVLNSGGTLATAYTPVSAANSLINLPPDPTNFYLLFSELGDPSNSSANFIEIYNAGPTSVDLSSYLWYLSVDGSSSVLLTGTLPAGDTYVIANNAGDFTAAYPGKSYDLVSNIIGTAGTTGFELSIYGDHTDGMTVDIYNGSTSGYNFSGKHAVRRYDVVYPNSFPSSSEWVITAAENIDMTPGSHRQTLAWTGISNDTWRDATNWSPQYVPDAGHNIQIPETTSILPVVGTGETMHVNDLHVDGNAD